MAVQLPSVLASGKVDVLVEEILPAVPPRKAKKKLVRRVGEDRSQIYRRGFQLAFLGLNLWLGGKFYFWVRQFETGNISRGLQRPAGVEGWLPIAGLMNLKYWILSGHFPQVHPAAMFLLIAFLAMSFLLRKAFCSWLCPVGTISEYLWRLGKKLFGRNFPLPRWIDLPMRGFKYLLLGFFVWAISTMSVVGIKDFMQSPYGLIADVKMLNFFRHIGETGSHCAGSFRGGVGVCTEFLVPVLVPLWRVTWFDCVFQPRTDSPQDRAVYRLRQMREGLPGFIACGQIDLSQVGRVHRLPGVRDRVPGR